MKRKLLLALLGLAALIVPLASGADVPANPTPFTWAAGSASSANGTIGPFPCANANTGTFTFTNGGGASFTVQTAADSPYSAAYATATSFGSSGIIAAPSANSQSSGALGASAVAYVRATYTGNTGTIAGSFTCSASTTGGGGGGSGSPITCASPGCTVIPIGSPLPSPSPANYPGVVGIKQGTGTAEYMDTWPDNDGFSASIVTATTTLLVPGVAGQNMYVWRLYAQASGANTTDFVQAEWGTGATCGTGTHPIGPAPQQAPASLNNYGSIWASGIGTGSSAFGPPGPATAPLIVPAGNNLCGVTTGTTISVYFVWDVAIHAN